MKTNPAVRRHAISIRSAVTVNGMRPALKKQPVCATQVFQRVALGLEIVRWRDRRSVAAVIMTVEIVPMITIARAVVVCLSPAAAMSIVATQFVWKTRSVASIRGTISVFVKKRKFVLRPAAMAAVIVFQRERLTVTKVDVTMLPAVPRFVHAIRSVARRNGSRHVRRQPLNFARHIRWIEFGGVDDEIITIRLPT